MRGRDLGGSVVSGMCAAMQAAFADTVVGPQGWSELERLAVRQWHSDRVDIGIAPAKWGRTDAAIASGGRLTCPCHSPPKSWPRTNGKCGFQTWASKARKSSKTH